MEKFKQYFLKTVAALLWFVAISSVNSACAVIFRQEKEPDSLSKYKKILIPNDNNLADCGTTIHNLVL